MPNYLFNRLVFHSNAEFILDLIRPARPAVGAPGLISLNAVKPMPEPLALPLTRSIRALALMNMKPLPVAPEVASVAMDKIFKGRTQEATRTDIEAAIAAVRARRRARKASPANPEDPELLDRAERNYRQYGFFSHYDWRWTHWGTVEDIHSVAPQTFRLPTGAIEFTTRWTPPIAAMEALAQMFPSVRFELGYRYRRRDEWTTVEIFPITPFGY